MRNFFHKIWPITLLILLCLFIVGTWFKDGKLLATGEDGLFLVNPDRAIELYKYSWQEVVIPGGASPGFNARLPLLYFESYIIKAGTPIWVFQAGLLFLLMVTGPLSVYFLSKELLKNYVVMNSRIKVSAVAALFYLLNPVSLLTTWDRGLAVYSFIFFSALAPLFFYLYLYGINRKKASFIILGPLITLFFSTAFSSPAEPFLLWLLPFIYSITLSFDGAKRELKFRIFPIIYFIATFAVWTLINLWWIFPWVGFSNAAFLSNSGNLLTSTNTLKANSQDFTIDNVVRLIHGGFLFRNEAFGPIYKNPIFLLFSWLIPIITFYGLWKLDKGQIKSFFLYSLIILIFIAKGTSLPLGTLFLWLFTHISILQVFRNPFEKVGMLLPTVYAPLFSLGLYYFLSKYQNLKTRNSLMILTVVCLLVYNWPFFTRALVIFGSRDIRVEVPATFKNANQALPTGDHYILSVPIMGGASGYYNWQYPFKGLEASQYLFNYPVVSGVDYADTTYGQLLIGMSNGYLNNLIGLAQIFSTDIIAYRKDIDIKAYGYNLDALDRFGKMIQSSNLNKIFDSKEVSLWTLPKDKIVPIIYAPTSIRSVDSPKEIISLLENKQFDPKHEAFICVNENKCRPYLKIPDSSLLKINGSLDKIEINKMSPVKYQIKIYNSPGRFLLVFNNNYHPGWEASVEGKVIPPDKHIIVNGYANGFIIDQVGDFEISLFFAPEKEFQLFYKISMLAIVLGMALLLPMVIYEFKLLKRGHR